MEAGGRVLDRRGCGFREWANHQRTVAVLFFERRTAGLYTTILDGKQEKQSSPEFDFEENIFLGLQSRKLFALLSLKVLIFQTINYIYIHIIYIYTYNIHIQMSGVPKRLFIFRMALCWLRVVGQSQDLTVDDNSKWRLVPLASEEPMKLELFRIATFPHSLGDLPAPDRGLASRPSLECGGVAAFR